MATSLHFVVIGRGNLTRACCALLIERGHRLCAVVSDDEVLRQWAKSVAVPGLATPAGLADLTMEISSSVLLSIANEQLTPLPVLQLFGHAINYHDGPLPRYAGSHATSWAIMARERTYAVSWHHMTAHTDAGDILLQVPVPIAPNETALTLDAKCHDAALESFPLLLDSLIQGVLTPRPQSLSKRTFFPRNRKPDNEAVLDWNREADDLSALVRALTFGSYLNRLGLPKVLLKDGFVAFQSLDVCAARSVLAPGTLVSVKSESLVVATATHDVALRDFFTLDGRVLPVAQLVLMFGLQVDPVLPAAGSVCMRNMSINRESVSRHEAAWMDDFKHLIPLTLPIPTTVKGHPIAGKRVVLPSIANRLTPAENAGDFALAVVAAYLARISGATLFDIGLRDGNSDTSDCADALLAKIRPFRVAFDFNQPFVRFHSDCLASLASWRARGAYMRDAVMRYPGVRLPKGWDDFSSWPIMVNIGDAATDNLPYGKHHEASSGLIFGIDAATGEVALEVHNKTPDGPQIDRLSAQLMTLFEDCMTKPNLRLGDLTLLSSDERAALRREVLGSPAYGSNAYQ